MTTLDAVKQSTAATLSITQTAELFADLEGRQPDERTVRRACEMGQIPCIRIGKRMFVLREPLLAKLAGAA